MAFVREIERIGVLYSGIWPRHRVSNQIESIYRKEYIAINQIEKKRYINDIPKAINNRALQARYGVSNQIETI